MSERTPAADPERSAAGLTVEQRVLMQLADLLVETGEVLELLRGDDAATLRWIAPHVRRIHEAIDDAMSHLTH